MKLPSDLNIVAVNFGLFESESGYQLYLIGSSSYDDTDDDWSTNEDFIPKQKYFDKVLRAKDYQQTLFETETLINKFLSSDSYEDSILNEVKYITYGFDDGDLHNIDKK
jgi:hypothetical protein